MTAGKGPGTSDLNQVAGGLSCMAEMGRSVLRTPESKHFFEFLLSNQTVTYSIPQS